MLLDDQSEEDLKQVAIALAAAYGITLIGKAFEARINGKSLILTVDGQTRSLPILRQAYIAGKVARQIGSNDILNMSADQVSKYISENSVTLTEADEAVLNRLERDTLQFLEGRAEDWKVKIGTALSNSDKSFAAALAAHAFPDYAQISGKRATFLQKLLLEVNTLMPGFRYEAQRLLQTETSNYFQHGQTTGRSPEEIVYKEVRDGCCIHCARLHIGLDGPRKYKLAAVAGNSNYGAKAWDWVFTIGPVHPHCYCVLYYESDGTSTDA